MNIEKKLTATKEMNKAIKEKETLILSLNKMCDELIEKEIFEEIKRSEIINELEENATSRITDKTKQAKADTILKDIIIEIKHLENNISKTKRLIGLCDDKISLNRNIIRELDIRYLIATEDKQ